MKKLVLVVIAFVGITLSFAQTKSMADLSKRAGDHFMLQLSSDHWTGMPDSIKNHTTGLSRGANIYIMMDKPFKTNPHYSIAYGIGIGTSSMFFKTVNIDVKSTSTKLPFGDLSASDHFKKYKLATAFLQVPVELRFVDQPLKNKSLKAAIGVKVGTLLNAHTKGKTLLNKSGGTINSYTEKESDKRFFNSTQLCATGRVGYGNYSLFGSFQVTNLLKDGTGPAMHPFQIGICVSGL